MATGGALLLGSPAPAEPAEPAAAAVGAAAPDPDAATELAEAYGLAGWGRIDRIDFAFEVTPLNGPGVRRDWSWRPDGSGGGGHVVLNPGRPGEIRFHTDDPSGTGTPLSDAMRHFVNDTYWLVFPFQLVWSDPELTPRPVAPMPVSGDAPARVLTARWPAEGGFTPGDAYDLYLGEDGRIREWVFRQTDGSDDPRPATWEREVTAAGVTFATEHRGPGGPNGEFRLSHPQLRVWADGAEEPEVLR